MARRHGADGFANIQDHNVLGIIFTIRNLRIRISISLPDVSDFALSENGRSRSEEQAERFRDDEVRRRARCLVLLVKAKFVAVADGLKTIEEEFLPYIVTNDNEMTVAELFMPKLLEAAKERRLPSGRLLPAI